MSWRFFWLFWGGGLLVFALLVATGGTLDTTAAPNGIIDHQAAGNAERVDAIQQSWAQAGVLGGAAWRMAADLLFITLFTIGGIIGGRLIWRDARPTLLKKTALIAVLAYALFGLSDMLETGAQLIQLVSMQGNDLLAGLAALMQPIKVASFVAGLALTVLMLIWDWGTGGA
jgi:fumarate reductase subunit D